MRWSAPVLRRRLFSILFVALPLVEPVLRPGQAFRPVVQVEITPPGIGIGPILVLRRTPWEISSCFPWQPIVLAHRSSHCARRRTMRHRLPKCPAGTPCFGAFEPRWQVAGPVGPAPHPVLLVCATARGYEVGFVTAPGILGSPFPLPVARATIPPLSFGTWRSPVAHCNGVAGVAGSNPAVPIGAPTGPVVHSAS
jgi:hypothetical protein